MDNYFFPFFEICFRLRFDISHLKNLWAVGASWRARWPGSQILILILPMLMLMWPTLILILMWPVSIYIDVTDIDFDIRFQNQHLSHWAIQLISGSHCTYCIHHLAINFFVSEWRIENVCLKHVKHWIKFSSLLGVGGESIRLAFQTAFVQPLIKIDVIKLTNYCYWTSQYYTSFKD